MAVTLSPKKSAFIVEGKAGDIAEPQVVQLIALNSSEANDEQPPKALFPIEVTFSGIVIELREEQPLKAYSPMDFTDSGIVKFSSWSHRVKK